MNNNEKIEKMRHTLSHVLAAAVKELYPTTTFGIGPAIEKGFYYDTMFYESETTKVFGTEEFDYSDAFGAELVKYYRYNLVEKLSDIEGTKWIILDKDSEIRWNYIYRIETDGHVAIKVL